MDAKEFEARQQSLSLKELIAEYSVNLAKNAMQLAPCNAAHSVDQRLARWLLQMTEGPETNVLYATHEDVGSVLGVGRSYVTRMLLKLQLLGAISCQRGMIDVKDSSALREISCGCEIPIGSRRKTFGMSLRIYIGRCYRRWAYNERLALPKLIGSGQH